MTEQELNLPTDEELNNMTEEEFQAMLDTFPTVTNSDMRRFMSDFKRRNANDTKPTVRKTVKRNKNKAARKARKANRK